MSTTIETRIGLLMITLREFYKDINYINQIKQIIEENSEISLRILDWFITNYSKKIRTVTNSDIIDVYLNYKLQLRSFSKSLFDPFSRKHKIAFYYTDINFINTSCGQLCFFKWCFENGILDYVKKNFDIIEADMKNSMKEKKSKLINGKRQPLSQPSSRSLSKINNKYTCKFN